MLGEDLAHDALVAALEQWPATGVPRNPGAWLMATAKNRAIDLFRRNTRLQSKHVEIAHELEARQETAAADNYHHLPTVRGDLLAKLDRFDEARLEFERAAALTRNARERDLLLARAAACTRGSAVPASR